MNIPWMILPAILLEALFYFFPLITPLASRFSRWGKWPQAALIFASGVAPILVLHAGLGVEPEGLAVFLAALAVVCLWHLVLPPKPVTDVMLMALLAAFILAPWFQPLFPTPPGGPKLTALAKLLWLRIGIAIYVFPRRFVVPGFSLWPDRKDWLTGLGHFLVFFGVLLPVGLYFGILRFQLPRVDLWVLPFLALGTFLGVYLFVAYGEEYFFRGVLQPVLARGLGSKLMGLLVSSACFGAVHLPYRNFPNWRFALLAAVAGIFYGKAFESARSLRAAMIAHALVVTVWTVAFARSL